jgi:hypothetical protein
LEYLSSGPVMENVITGDDVNLTIFPTPTSRSMLDEKIHQGCVVSQRVCVSLEWFIREAILTEIKQTDIMIRRQTGSEQMKIITTGWERSCRRTMAGEVGSPRHG